MPINQSTADRAWFIAQRWQQYEGEARVNLLRVSAIGAFYLLHFWNYLESQGKLPEWNLLELDNSGAVDRRFHLLATLLAFSWVAASAAVYLCLRNRIFPHWISAASTSVDLVMLTSVLCISTGPRSPLVVGYFLIIVLSALRFNLPLVRLTTLGAAIGYVRVLGMAESPERFGQNAAPDLRVPRYEQLVTLAAIVFCGMFTGQIIRRARYLGEKFKRRSEAA